MLTVTKECHFDAAHVLTNHAGQCKNLHGHTYRLRVKVAQPADSTGDMVIDFKDLKHVMQDVILARFDHVFMYDESSASECEIAAVITRHGMRTMALPFRTTAENLARFFYNELKPNIPSIASVTVFETPESCAEYME